MKIDIEDLIYTKLKEYGEDPSDKWIVSSETLLPDNCNIREAIYFINQQLEANFNE